MTVLYAQPDGLNINEGCGSTHIESLQAAVLVGHADLGIAFDGDGDRVLMVDHTGAIVDGDGCCSSLPATCTTVASCRAG